MPRELVNEAKDQRGSDQITISKTPNIVNIQTLKGENFVDDKSIEDNLYSQILNPTWGGPKP